MTSERLAKIRRDTDTTDQLIRLAGVGIMADAVRELISEVERLRAAIARHHAQRADDRCQFDDDELYAAAGLPPVDRRVGDKAAMLANCKRFIEQRCEAGGPWKSYAELEAENAKLREALKPFQAAEPT